MSIFDPGSSSLLHRTWKDARRTCLSTNEDAHDSNVPVQHGRVQNRQGILQGSPHKQRRREPAKFEGWDELDGFGEEKISLVCQLMPSCMQSVAGIKEHG